MEEVSTSNLTSSKMEKKTACNLQNMNSFVISHDLIRGQIGSDEKKSLLIRSFAMAEL